MLLIYAQYGAVAHLVERLNGIQKVVGSSPISSNYIILPPSMNDILPFQSSRINSSFKGLNLWYNQDPDIC